MRGEGSPPSRGRDGFGVLVALAAALLATTACGDSVEERAEAVSRIVVTATRAGTTDSYVIHSDGSGLTDLTDHPGNHAYASWPPGGGRIVFEARREGALNSRSP